MAMPRGKGGRSKCNVTTKETNYSDMNNLMNIVKAPGNPYKSTFDKTDTYEAKQTQAAYKSTVKGKSVNFGLMRFE